MINPGLLLLIRLGMRGAVRGWWRRLRTVRGALLTLVVVPLLLLVVGSQIFLLFALPDAEVPRPDPDVLRLAVPAMGLFLLLVEAWGGRALAFRPQELDFLFPAPVSRRELLAYHLLSRLPVRILSALWLSLFTVRMSGHPLGGVVTPVLLFTFIHVAVMLVALLGAASGAWLGRWTSRGLWIGAAGVLVWSAAGAVGAAGDLGTGVLAALRTPVFRALALPLRPFGEMYAAAGTAELLPWGAAALGLIGVATAAVFALDVAYTERAVIASRRALERLRRAGAGQAGGAARPWKLRVRIPLPRPLGGAAPLAWRQTLELVRTPHALALPFLVPALYGALFLGGPLLEGKEVSRELAAGAVAAAVLIPLLIPNVGFDFRRDLDRMALLRALPLRPVAVAAGQVVAPTVAFLAAQATLVTAVVAISGAFSPLWLLAVVSLGAPLTWAVVALDNLLFLWMPYRFSPDGAQNVQFAGKTMLTMAIKMVALGVLTGIAAGAGWIASRITGSPPLGVATAVAVLALECVPLTWAVGAAFQGFDLASDVPA